jgi:hypothetical protein
MHIEAIPPEIVIHIAMTTEEAAEFLERVEFADFVKSVREAVRHAFVGGA